LYANLDVDDVSSYGPETITIITLANGIYDYYIQDFSNLSSTTSNYLRNSQAVVRVYSATNELLETYNVPTAGGASTIWHVFSLNVVNGVYTVLPINTMHNNPTSSSNVGNRSTILMSVGFANNLSLSSIETDILRIILTDEELASKTEAMREDFEELPITY
jgi:hypothetical protein